MNSKQKLSDFKLWVLLGLMFLGLKFGQLNAQVKVGDNPSTINGSAGLEIESINKGFLPPRLTTTQRNSISSPATGLVIFNTTINCFQINFGTASAPKWDCLSSINASTNGTGSVSGYDCTNGTLSGALSTGNVVSDVTKTIIATVTEVGTYDISAISNGVIFRATGAFTATGSQNIVMVASGTPIATGTTTFTLNTTPNCSFTMDVSDGSSNGTAKLQNFDCNGGSAGTMNIGQSLSGVTQTIVVDVVTAGTYSISASANGVTFQSSGTLSTGNGQNIVLTASGTPVASGQHNFVLNTTPGCVFQRTVAGNPVVASLNCSVASLTGSLLSGTAASGVFISIPYTTGNGMNYNSQLVASTGVTGLTAALSAGTLASKADGTLIFSVTGTPSNTGTATFAVTFGGQSCNVTVNVNAPAAIAALDCAGSTPAGTMTSGVAASGVTQSIPYTGGNGGTYSNISISGGGVGGLTATAAAGSVANGAGNLVLTISGTPSANGTATFTVTFAGQTCSFSRTVGTGPTVTGLTCGSATRNPSTATNGVAYTGTATVPYTGGNGSFYSAGSGIASTGVTGLTATLQAGTLATGAGNLTYSISGTPAATGTATFALSFGGRTCNLTLSVVAAFNPSTITAGTGSFSGKTCFDIALGNNNTNSCGPLSARTANQSDFTQSSTNTQTYTFKAIGTVSNVRFYYVNNVGNGVTAISGGNTGNNISTSVTATVSYNTSNNSLAAGLTNSNAMSTTIYAVYNINATNNNNPSDDRVLALTAYIKDCACCMAKVSSTTWKEFLCHNLGADNTLDPHTPVVGLQGAYIQWGKRGPNTTGNSAVDWQTAASNGSLGFAAAPTSSNANAGAITGWSTTYASNGAWGATKTASDPCPAGYRVPTGNEWVGVDANNAVSRTGTWTSGTTSYGSMVHYGPSTGVILLSLPAAGTRLSSDGTLNIRGSYGRYWGAEGSSTFATDASVFFFSSTGVYAGNTNAKLGGNSVRCIAE